MKKYTLKDIPKSQRPYERFYNYGAKSLSDQEIIAILIGSGSKDMNALATAGEILARFTQHGGLAELRETSITELCLVKGIGKKKAIRIKAAFELARRCERKFAPEKLDCSDPETIAEYYQAYFKDLAHEEVIALFLDRNNRLIREKLIAKGGISSASYSVKDVFQYALKIGALSIVLMHNHPSGNPKASRQDIKSTQQFIEAAKVLGLNVHDHIIFTDREFNSLRFNKLTSFIF